MEDKKYCMSSYLAFRYIEDDEKDFYKGLKHKSILKIPSSDRIPVRSAEDIDYQIQVQMDNMSNEKLGILLSGGMDSAILASYMKGMDAYTFRFLDGVYQKDELNRAESYAKRYHLTLHYVDIDWGVVKRNLRDLMKSKAAPVHSIESQICEAAIESKEDEITKMIIGESSDLIFGGMDQLLQKDWGFNEFKDRYTFTNPEYVLNDPEDMSYLFERYRIGDNINFMQFMDDVFSVESSSSYYNAFTTAKVSYNDPYAPLIMSEKLDLNKVRSGNSKYLIRELFKMKYPDMEIPEKVPMPRPVDYYFKNWGGPTRSEFKNNINMNEFTGNQKWQMFCLEDFLNMHDSDD